MKPAWLAKGALLRRTAHFPFLLITVSIWWCSFKMTRNICDRENFLRIASNGKNVTKNYFFYLPNKSDNLSLCLFFSTNISFFNLYKLSSFLRGSHSVWDWLHSKWTGLWYSLIMACHHITHKANLPTMKVSCQATVDQFNRCISTFYIQVY